MQLRRPRRIFRASSLGGTASGHTAPLPRVVLAGLAGGAIGAVLLLTGLPPLHLYGRTPPPADVVAAEARQVAVVDGGTLRLADTVVRLHDVLAPARGRLCQDGTGAAYDCGAAASSALAALVRDRRVACRLTSVEATGLAEGACEAGGSDLGRALVAAGWARADGPTLLDAEASARSSHVGVWRNGAHPGF